MSDVDRFIEINASSFLEERRDIIVTALKAFLTPHAGRRVALVTSGGTNVPLEQSGVRHITNFSSGGRGSALTEYLLIRGYAVVLLAKKGSLLPFHRHFQRETFSAASFEVNAKNEVKAKPDVQNSMAEVVRAYDAARGFLHVLSFETVGDYLMLLRLLCITLRDNSVHDPRRVAIILAAAVSDFYVPWDIMPQHKLQSRDHDGLLLHLQNVPKALGCVSQDWAAGAFIVGFKLESDDAILKEKAIRSMEMYRLHATVANMITNYNDKVTVYVSDGSAHTVERAPTEEIEERIVSVLVSLHTCYDNNKDYNQNKISGLSQTL